MGYRRILSWLKKFKPDSSDTVLYLIVGFVLLYILLVSLKAEAHEREPELRLHGGSAVIRGYTPYIGFDIAYPDKGPVGLDYEFGFRLIGESTDTQYNPNQVVLHAMAWDGYRGWEMGLGFGWFNNESSYTCQFNFALGARYRADRWSIGWQHYSSSGSCRPNKGRDLLGVSYRF